MPPKLLRILMATDIPFWNAATGAEQRMWSLVKFLNKSPFEVTTFFVGQVTPADHKRITSLGLKVVFFEHEKPPPEFLGRLKWYIEATRHQVQRWLNQGKKHAAEVSGNASTEAITPLTLSDYRWPWAMDQFRRCCEEYRPHVFLSQYVTMAYLLDALPPKQKSAIHTVLDTHDILHDRGSQFGAAGYLHWLEIDEAEEVSVWNRFHTILAIQQNEAELIRSMTNNLDVLCVGHAPPFGEVLPVRSHKTTDGVERVVVGYIGSANYSNWHAINRFLIEVWPELTSLSNVEVELVIAGKICEWFFLDGNDYRERSEFAGVRFLGEVAELADFYREVDIVVNPVQFGTGLKIKNVEALAFAKPLVTTESGAGGISQSLLASCEVVASLREMADRLVELCESPEKREELRQKSILSAKQSLSETVVYSELAQHLLDSAKKDFQILPS